MPHQQNPDDGPADAARGTDRPHRNPGRHTATPDAPQLPRQRREQPVPPRQYGAPPAGRQGMPTGRATPPGGMPPSGPGRPPADRQHRTSVMPGPGVAGPSGRRTTAEPQPTVVAPGRRAAGQPGGPNGPTGRGPGGRGPDGEGASGGDTKAASDLNVNKVVAGAGAAIVTAVLGSFLGAVGTILGAALGSIITTVATTFFQRSIEHTKTKVVGTSQRLRERKKGPDGTAVWQAAAQDGSGAAGPDGQETVRLDPQAGGTGGRFGGLRRVRLTRKQIVVAAVGAVVAFGVAMFLITGIELIKGGGITGSYTGTSVSNAVGGPPPQQEPKEDTSGDSAPSAEPSTSTGESATSTSESSESSTSTSENGQEDGSQEPGSEDSGNPLQDGLNQVVPTQEPESGRLQSGQDDSGQTGQNGTGGGAAGN